MADLTIDVDTRAAISSINGLKTAISGLLLGLTTGALIDFADSITTIQNRLVALNPNLEETTKQFKAIAGIAITTRAPLEAVGELYSKIARNADYLGISQRQTANITETLSKMMAISGASTREAAGPMLQFGQALAAGKFQGDELRSILEGFQPLAQAIADKLGVTTGALKKMGSEGKISALDVIAALEQVAPKIDEQFARTIPTITGSLEVLKTTAKIVFDDFEKNTETGKSVGAAIEYLAFTFYKLSKSIDEWAETAATIAKWVAIVLSFTVVGRVLIAFIDIFITLGIWVKKLHDFMLPLGTLVNSFISLFGDFGIALRMAFGGIIGGTIAAAMKDFILTLKEGYLAVEEFFDKLFSAGKQGSDSSEELKKFREEIRGSKDDLSDQAKASQAAKDAAEELRKKLALFKFETGKAVENYDEMVRKSLQARNNVVDLQMAQGKLTNITKDEFEIQDGINKFLDQRSGILNNLEEQVKKVKLDQALKIGDSKENAGKLAILNAAIKEVKQSSAGYISVLTTVIEKEQELRRLQFIRANDIKTYQAEVDQAKELASALGVIYDAESAAEKASLGRIESLRKGNELTDAKYRLEKALIGVNQIDADLLRKTFDLYQKQQDAIDQVGRTANLTAEARANEEQRIRQETQKSIDLAVEQAADAKTRQQDFSLGWNEAFRQYAEDAANANKRGAESFQFFSRSVEDAFVNLTHGIKSAVKSLVNSVVVELARIAARQTIAAASGIGGGAGLFASVGKFLGFGGGGGSSGYDPTASIAFAPGFAAGGSVMANQPVMVGERGPEMFLPASAGSIIPNNQLGGQSVSNNTNVTYNINAVDASSFRSLVARDPAFIFNISEVGRRNTPQRSV